MSTTYQDLPLTTFPEAIDNITTLMNISTTDAPLVKQFQSYILAGNFASAQQTLNQIQNGTKKILTPTYFNTLREAIIAVERFYHSDVEQYIEDKQTTWESIVWAANGIHLYQTTACWRSPYEYNLLESVDHSRTDWSLWSRCCIYV